MKTIIISEIGINANGDISIAKKLIDLAKQGGCQYVKFQKRTIEDVYTKEELDKPRESPWGTTNRDQKNGLEFTLDQYKEIDKYCKEIGIGWFASPWDIKSVDFLINNFNLPYIKIASASITDITLLNRIKETNIPVILSTGMSTELEINNAVQLLGSQIKYILHCKATYPTKVEDMNMLAIKTLQAKYCPDYNIGFSNHSSGISFIMMAYCLGASMIEYHITLDRTMYGSDQASSIEPTGVMKIKDWIESYEKCWGDGYIDCLPNEIPVRDKLRKK
jgi:N-acetylneuraminate synthase